MSKKTQAFLLYRSEVVSATHPDSSWPSFEISTASAGGVDAPLYFCVYSFQGETGNHELLGRCKTTIRDLGFTPFSFCLKHPQKKFPLPRVRGRLSVASAEALEVASESALPAGVSLKVEAKGTAKLPEMLFELYAHGGPESSRRLIYRSEARSNKSPLLQWSLFPFWLCLDPSASQSIMEMVFYRFSHHKLKYVGRTIFSASEIFLPSTVLPLIAPDGNSAAGIDISIAERHSKPPQLFPATGYAVSGRVDGSENQLELFSYPASFAKADGSPVLVWSSVGASKFQASWTLESVGGLDREFRFVVGKSFAKLTMRQLTFGLPAVFSLGSCRVVIDRASPLTGSVVSYSLGFSAVDVDPTDGVGEASDPYLIIRRPDGAVVSQTEVVEGTLCPTWAPLTVEIAALGSLDADVIFEVWDYDPITAHDFIGAAQLSLRQMLLKGRIALINSNKKNVLSGYLNSGMLHLRQVTPNLVPQVLGAPFSIAEQQTLPPTVNLHP